MTAPNWTVESMTANEDGSRDLVIRQQGRVDHRANRAGSRLSDIFDGARCIIGADGSTDLRRPPARPRATRRR